jgi:hypothetical protein
MGSSESSVPSVTRVGSKTRMSAVALALGLRSVERQKQGQRQADDVRIRAVGQVELGREAAFLAGA